MAVVFFVIKTRQSWRQEVLGRSVTPDEIEGGFVFVCLPHTHTF